MSNDANKLGLHFNEDALVNDLILHLFKAMNKLADELYYQMQSRTGSQKVAQSLEKHIYLEGIKQIIVIVGSNHWMAFLENYGTGSLMASEAENPHLAMYMRSGYWNPARPKVAKAPVTGRPKGTYYSPDFSRGDSHVQKTSPGTYEGQNLEDISIGTKVMRNSRKMFVPKAGSFFVETSMTLIRKRFEDILLEAVNTFPWDSDKYLKGGV